MIFQNKFHKDIFTMDIFNKKFLSLLDFEKMYISSLSKCLKFNYSYVRKYILIY